MKALFRIRDYRLLWTGQAVSNFGDALTNLALLLTAQRLTGSTAAVATTAIAIALPTLLFGLFAGAYVDRWNRKRVMIVSDLFRTGLVLLFLLVTSVDLMWLLYTVAFLQAGLGTFFNPAKSAYIPRIVGAEHLLTANSVSQMTQITFGLVGTAAAGLIAATTEDLALAYMIDAGTFLVSLTVLSLIRTNADPEPRDSTQSAGILDDVRIGLSTVWASPVLRGVMVGAAIVMFGLGAVNVLLVPFIVEDLAVPETWFAAIEGSQVISMVAASALVASLAKRLRPTTLITLGLAIIGALTATMSTARAPWHLMVILFFIGWAITPLQASISTLVQTEIPDRLLGRTGAALSTVTTGASVASMALAGVLAATLGVRGVFVLAGGIGLVAAALTFLEFRRAPAIQANSGSVEIEGDVEIGSAVGERSDTDHIDAGFGDGANRLTSDRHVVQEHDVGPHHQQLTKLLERFDLHFDFHGVPDAGSHHCDRSADSSGCGDVIVLDHHGVIQPESVVGASPHPDRILLQGPQSRCGLASIGDHHTRS